MEEGEIAKDDGLDPGFADDDVDDKRTPRFDDSIESVLTILCFFYYQISILHQRPY